MCKKKKIIGRVKVKKRNNGLTKETTPPPQMNEQEERSTLKFALNTVPVTEIEPVTSIPRSIAEVPRSS